MMNKDEAVQKLATAGRLSIAHAEDLYDSFFPKPVVSQVVADWYEEHKNDLNEDIWAYLTSWADTKWDEFKYWMYHTGRNKAITTLVNMHQFGYEVKEETKYRVKMKSASYNGYPQFLCRDTQEIFWASGTRHRRTQHTRKELEEANFGWVFDCEGIEVEEVDDGND
jgi:hypothetical protein